MTTNNECSDRGNLLVDCEHYDLECEERDEDGTCRLYRNPRGVCPGADEI